jgi:hypothetical protein
MTESVVAEHSIDLSIGSPELAGPVLERLVSAAAARAELPVGNLGLVVDNLVDGQAEAIRDAAIIPGVGNALAQTATEITIEHEGSRSALVVSLD